MTWRAWCQTAIESGRVQRALAAIDAAVLEGQHR